MALLEEAAEEGGCAVDVEEVLAWSAWSSAKNLVISESPEETAGAAGGEGGGGGVEDCSGVSLGGLGVEEAQSQPMVIEVVFLKGGCWKKEARSIRVEKFLFEWRLLVKETGE